MENQDHKTAAAHADCLQRPGSADDMELKESVAAALSEAFGQCLSYQRGEIKKNQAPPWAKRWLESHGLNPPNGGAKRPPN